MPKAAVQQYTDLQSALDALNALEASARAQGDRALEGAARRARKELALPSSRTTPALRREHPNA